MSKKRQFKKEIQLEVKDVLKEREELKQKKLEEESIWNKIYIEMWEKELKAEYEIDR